MSLHNALEVFALPGLPDIAAGDDLVAIVGDALEAAGVALQDGDVLCCAHKIFSKSEGCVYHLRDVTPSAEALEYAEKLNKDAAKVEVILRQSAQVVKAFRRPGQEHGTMICEHRLGFISANAAVDQSNAEDPDTVITLPDDPDASIMRFCEGLSERFNARLGAVMTDTFGRPWRIGQVNVVVGLAHVPATLREQGNLDAWGQPLFVTEPALADEIAAASGLVIRKASKTPVVLFRGLDWQPDAMSRARDILRAKQEDMFR